MTLHVFNPEHDMALAAGTASYTPTRIIQRMARELAWLPTLWADGCVSDVSKLECVRTADGICMGDDVPWGEVTRVEPWGWDAALKHRLLRLGVPESALATDEEIAAVRRLSSRRMAVEALAEFRASGIAGLCGESVWIEDAGQLPQWDEMVLKAPWSSSGRGLMFVSGTMTEAQMGWCRNVLARQGGIAVERLCRKRHDCALEYEIDGGVRCVGLSLFANSPTGAYAGNLLTTQEHKLALLSLSESRLADIAAMHTAWLSRHVAPHYRGPVGIDMMVCDGRLVNPCVEINVRRTMGHVSLAIERRLGTTPPRRFVVGYDKDTGYYARVVDC